MSLRERIAYFICPALRAEVESLRDGNTKVVLENQKLFDEIEALKHDLDRHLTLISSELTP
jgi:hypothetical protein